MIKKVLLIIFFILVTAKTIFAQEVFRVTSVNFDTSNAMIFLASQDNPDPEMLKDLKLVSLQNPRRAYFDINSAVLTTTPQHLFFNSGGIREIKIGQFSTNPNVIRVVLYLDEDFDQSKIKFLRIKNNIAISFKEEMCKEDYFQNTYRDERASSSDFYETLSVSEEETRKAVVSPAGSDMLSQIQRAFGPEKAENVTQRIKKELKLNSKYYLNIVFPKSNGILVSGFGRIGIEKPMYLTNPNRVVFDIPNTIVNPKIRNYEFKFGNDAVKIGQFETNKARIVITSNDLEKYFPVFSSDGQSILISRQEVLNPNELFTETNDAISYYSKETQPFTDEFIIAFNNPVIHSIQRDSSQLSVNFYNTLRYNEKVFKNVIKDSNFADMKIDLLPKVGLQLTLPLQKDSVVSSYLGSDARSFKIIVKGVKPKKEVCKLDNKMILPKCSGKNVVVLDPGHGGSDYGAIRNGINEKDITLEIAKRVEAILLSKGVIVEMTRIDDATVSLEDRTIFCANKAPNLFVSIHVNASVKPEINGIETHYYNQDSLVLAQKIHSSMVSFIKGKDRGLFKSKFYVINHTEVPAVLVEIGFISNDKERADLIGEKRKQQTAKAIADGILRYLDKK